MKPCATGDTCVYPEVTQEDKRKQMIQHVLSVLLYFILIIILFYLLSKNTDSVSGTVSLVSVSGTVLLLLGIVLCVLFIMYDTDLVQSMLGLCKISEARNPTDGSCYHLCEDTDLTPVSVEGIGSLDPSQVEAWDDDGDYNAYECRKKV